MTVRVSKGGTLCFKISRHLLRYPFHLSVVDLYSIIHSMNANPATRVEIRALAACSAATQYNAMPMLPLAMPYPSSYLTISTHNLSHNLLSFLLFP